MEDAGKIFIILNPIAGIGISEKLLHRITSFFKDKGYSVDFCETKRRGDAKEAVSRLSGDNHIVVIMGGDGTINEVLNGLENRKVKLGIIPTGTANVLAKELKIPFDIMNACEIITQGNELRLDLGKNDRVYFILVAGIGIDAMVVKDLSAARKGNISFFSYTVPIIKNLLNYKYPRLSVEVDGELIEDNAGLVFVGNTRCYGGPIEVTSHAKANDGVFDICIVKIKNRLSILGLRCRALMKILPESKDVLYTKGKVVSVTSDTQVPYQRDGDFAGYVPAMFEIVPNAVSVLVPESVKLNAYRGE